VIHRSIEGAAGDLYDHHSEACHAALQQLRDVFDAIGFKVRKKSAGESTLRVYIKGP